MRAAAKKKRPEKPLYLRCEALVRPATGESVLGWTAVTQWDARAMKERGYAKGSEVRAVMRKPRNVKFNRLSHAIGALMVEQHESFAGMGTHDAPKRLQTECGAACETVEYDIPGVGKLTRTEPKSLAFDSMDEGEFSEVMRSIYQHIAAKYWPDMDAEAVEELVLMYDKDAH